MQVILANTKFSKKFNSYDPFLLWKFFIIAASWHFSYTGCPTIYPRNNGCVYERRGCRFIWMYLLW